MNTFAEMILGITGLVVIVIAGISLVTTVIGLLA
jgi:hypothetical protein